MKCAPAWAAPNTTAWITSALRSIDHQAGEGQNAPGPRQRAPRQPAAIGMGAAQTHRSSDRWSNVIENPEEAGRGRGAGPGGRCGVAVQDQTDREERGSLGRQIGAGAGEPQGTGGRRPAHGPNLATPRDAKRNARRNRRSVVNPADVNTCGTTFGSWPLRARPTIRARPTRWLLPYPRTSGKSRAAASISSTTHPQRLSTVVLRVSRLERPLLGVIQAGRRAVRVDRHADRAPLPFHAPAALVEPHEPDRRHEAAQAAVDDDGGAFRRLARPG